jgi:hypothetical protein
VTISTSTYFRQFKCLSASMVYATYSRNRSFSFLLLIKFSVFLCISNYEILKLYTFINTTIIVFNLLTYSYIFHLLLNAPFRFEGGLFDLVTNLFHFLLNPIVLTVSFLLKIKYFKNVQKKSYLW